ncbi:MAG: BTAD domain-containing putative transcriptional regulator [Coriobacteriia bacterium]|nr:BTAD domain-containing putative transcriptional regulator [Coriobacteriia bacterium]
MPGHAACTLPPDYSSLARRVRLDRVIDSAGGRPCVIAAPPGWGKTVVASHYAARFNGWTCWLDAAGNSVSEQLVLGAVEGARERACLDPKKAGSGIVVLDDLYLGEHGLHGLMELQPRLASLGARLVVTTRCPFPSDASPGSRLPQCVGVAELRFSGKEATSLMASFGIETSAGPRLAALAAGHPEVIKRLAVHDTTEFGDAGHGLTDWLIRHVLGSSWDARLRLYNRVLMGSVVPDCRAPVRRSPETAFPELEGLHQSEDYSTTVTAAVVEAFRSEGRDETECVLSAVVPALVEAGDHEGALRAIGVCGVPELTAALLIRDAVAFESDAKVRELLQIMDDLPVHVMMEHACLVGMWALALYRSGLLEDAVAKARACLRLCAVDGDSDVASRARVTLIDALSGLQRFEEAATVIRQDGDDRRTRSLAESVAAACVEAYFGRAQEAYAAVDALSSTAFALDVSDYERLRWEHARASILSLCTGGYDVLAADLAVMIPRTRVWMREFALIRGNLGLALMETGRLARAGALLSAAVSSGIEDAFARYSALMLCVLAGKGDVDQALELVVQCIHASSEMGSEADLAGNRVYISTVLRAAGERDESLAAAERAYEHLCVVDYMGYRRLAALEVAASLLSLGDCDAARRWVATVEAEGFGRNRYHALRAAMILAECDRIDGEVEAGVARLAGHAEHILSESSNWQMAMYCRAFPGLLGMLAAAVTVKRLPVHMLRMVLPEYAERGLRACRAWLDADEWRALGMRTLGETGFGMLERRNGEPICRVRLLGGLDVVVGDRTVGERDWPKRKARLLFAMLVVKRGHDVPREQIFEHLWPDLDEERARNNLYVVWSAMKQALMGPTTRATKCPYLENKGGRLRVVSDVARSDIDEFEEALGAARVAEAAGDTDRALGGYVLLATVYRGDLLPGDIYDDWFAPLRDHYRLQFVDAMTRAAELLLERDDPCEALVYARRALAADPLREDVYQLALRCHISAGQRSGAIETFLQCRGRLSEDLGLDPSSQTMALYQEILVMEDSPRYDDYGLC